jgi:uncharacterized membrane protein
MCEHKHEVSETHKRSLLKGISSRVVEVLVDTAIISLAGVAPEVSLGLSIAVEASCFVLCYVIERIWNRIQWGRKIVMK